MQQHLLHQMMPLPAGISRTKGMQRLGTETCSSPSSPPSLTQWLHCSHVKGNFSALAHCDTGFLRRGLCVFDFFHGQGKVCFFCTKVQSDKEFEPGMENFEICNYFLEVKGKYASHAVTGKIYRNSVYRFL